MHIDYQIDGFQIYDITVIWFELQLLDAVFEALDVDEKGELDYSVYMREVLGQMNECRKTKVRKVSQPWPKKVPCKNYVLIQQFNWK